MLRNQGIYGVDMKAFKCLGDNIKWGQTTSKTISHITLEKLENADRSLFPRKNNCILIYSCLATIPEAWPM